MDIRSKDDYICLKCHVSRLYGPGHVIFHQESWESLPCRCYDYCGAEICEVD